MDAFLRWIVAQGYQDSLTQFVRDIQSPTVHALAKILLESAIRIKNVPVVNALLDCGLNLDGKLLKIASLGDIPLAWRVLSNINPSYLAGEIGAELLYLFVSQRQFELAQHLLANGVSADAQSAAGTALYRAVGTRDIEGIEFLLKAGADVNAIVRIAPGYHYRPPPSALGLAVLRQYAEIVKLLLDHGADVSSTIDGESLTGWAALHCRSILPLLEKHLDRGAAGFLLGDLVDAATRGPRALAAYIAKYPGNATTHQLERALEESIRGCHVTAAITLLQHGVNPNGPTLKVRPLVIALSVEQITPGCAELLLKYNADVQQPRVLEALALTRNSVLLNMALAAPVDMEQGVEALVRAADLDNIVAAAALIQAGVDLDMPRSSPRSLNPLQMAAFSDKENMVLFLIREGADTNAPAHPNGGRTALQSALEGISPIEVAEILLHHGADVSAPPAILDGVTALEAFCHNEEGSDEAFCHKLIDAGASINRPGGKPSSALHGAIRKKWHGVLRRLLKPPHNAIVDYMWGALEDKADEDFEWEARTPTQLAADLGDVEALKMLLDRGSSVNEAPGPRFGRTALQAASLRTPGPTKSTLIHFLLGMLIQLPVFLGFVFLPPTKLGLRCSQADDFSPILLSAHTQIT
jgi:ankyrin repeat protein